MKQVTLYLLTLLFSFSIFISTPALAEEKSSTQAANAKNKKQAIQDKKDQIKEKKEKAAENRCEVITKRLKERVDTYNASKQKHTEKYQRIKFKLATVNKKLKEENCKTEKLDEDLKTIDSLIKEFSTAYDTLITNLNSTEKNVCDQKNAGYSQTAKSVITQLKIVKQKIEAIRNYYNKTIRTHIKDIRQQCKIETSKQKDSTTSAKKVTKPVKPTGNN